jgi:hypothetical protein
MFSTVRLEEAQNQLMIIIYGSDLRAAKHAKIDWISKIMKNLL